MNHKNEIHRQPKNPNNSRITPSHLEMCISLVVSFGR